MPTQNEFASLTASIAEAVAACESAQADFQRIQRELDSLIARSRVLTLEHLEAEARAHRRLSEAVATLAHELKQTDDYRSAPSD